MIYASAVAPLIGRYCGAKIPPEIQSSSGLLSLSFHTDMAVAKDGFSARYNMTRKEVSDREWPKTLMLFSLLPSVRLSVCGISFFPFPLISIPSSAFRSS